MSGMANGTQIRAGIVRALARCKLECLFVVPLTVVVYTNNVERVLKERALARKSVIGSECSTTTTESALGRSLFICPLDHLYCGLTGSPSEVGKLLFKL